jgi:hypothetical protein
MMTAFIVVTSNDQNARKVADKIQQMAHETGVSLMGIYSHEPYRDGVRIAIEMQLESVRDKWSIVSHDDWPVRDFA